MVSVVFYNGSELRPEKEILRLSDSYEKKSDTPELELICTVYNINPNNNQEMLSHCPVLSEYQIFVEKVREYGTISIDIEESVKNAIDYCIKHHILEDFLKERGMEVLHNMTFDFTYERHTKFLEDELEETKQQLTQKDQQIMAQNQQLTEKDRQLMKKDQQITDQDQQLTEKDQQLTEKDQQLTEKDQLINTLLKENRMLKQARGDMGEADSDLQTTKSSSALQGGTLT